MNETHAATDVHMRAHRYHVRRRRLRNMVLLTTILGLLSLAISFFIFSYAMLAQHGNSDRILFLSLVYLGCGGALLVVRGIAAFFHNRMSPGSSSSSAPKEDFYNPSSSRRRRRSGAALVLVLSVLAVVTLLVARSQISALQAQHRDQRILLRARLQAAATDAAREALRRLADDEDLLVDHTNETWAIVREMKDPAGITTQVRITDQNRFFNLNNLTASPPKDARPILDIVMDLFTLCGDLTPAERLDALVDWMDPNDEGPAESRLYKKDRKLDYGPANRSLYSWGEWLHIAGFDREYFRRHERHSLVEVFSADFVDTFTIIPGRLNAAETVNVNTADLTVLTGILGLEYDEIAATVVSIRNRRPIRSLDELAGIAPPELALRVRNYLDTKSRVFTVEAWAYAEGRTERLHALVERDGSGDVSVIHWVM